MLNHTRPTRPFHTCLDQMHSLLCDGRERSTREIAVGSGLKVVNSFHRHRYRDGLKVPLYVENRYFHEIKAAIAELRANGAEIECRRIDDPATGARRGRYRMTRPARTEPTPDTQATEVGHDD